MPEHGGKLNAAAAHYGIDRAHWLDLSTGINPVGWPVPALPAHHWNRLPEADDDLIAAAQQYYNARHILPVAGSQAAIQALPQLRTRCRVGLLAPSYSEHAAAWRRAGHDVVLLAYADIASRIDQLDVLVLVNPNNPTGALFSTDTLLHWHTRLAANSGWLLIDEAFMDTTPDNSIAAFCTRPGLVVLRSLGKFFGLAGARVGFVIAESSLLQRLDAQLGPWTVCGPARHIATLALRDHNWQTQTREQLIRDAQRLRELLHNSGLTTAGGTHLFQWVITPQAGLIHDRLARQGILLRLFTNPASLRFGLPANETQWRQLQAALVISMEAVA